MIRLQFDSFKKGVECTVLFVIDNTIPKSEYCIIDLSENNTELADLDLTSAVEVENYIDSYLLNHDATIAFGGYLEKRNIYKRSTYFNSQPDSKDERNIHLGIDVWCKTGTQVITPFEGVIHSFENNLNHGDYGPTIILKHTFGELSFHTLYGHLSIESLENLVVGEYVNQGQVIAQIGDSTVNGDYAPHLHFQVILDIQDFKGDYPGVCSENTLSFYSDNCPELPIGN
jgi:murein DD-endopeptidase MepM/ murein hydrolase activator NlpD